MNTSIPVNSPQYYQDKVKCSRGIIARQTQLQMLLDIVDEERTLVERECKQKDINTIIGNSRSYLKMLSR